MTSGGGQTPPSSAARPSSGPARASHPGPVAAPSPPPDAAAAFGDHFPLACRYADWLAGAGVERGLIGPREVARLWPRHLLNCVAIAPLVPVGAHLVDVGSGAGLPGLVLAIARPDLDVLLVDAAVRRCTFLREVTADLGLPNVQVVQSRVEALPGPRADVVTARAVAPLPRLVSWCLPLLRAGGQLLAIRGERAATELADTAPLLARSGARTWEVVVLTSVDGQEPTTVVRVVAGSPPGPPAPPRPRRGGPRRSSRPAPRRPRRDDTGPGPA